MSDFPYEDIVNLPHHKSKTRKAMPILNRAAQFAPFAALTGYNNAVKEAARLTDSRIELDEYSKQEINRKLLYIQKHLDEKKEYTITYFVPDNRKDGGEYISKSGIISKIREFEKDIVMENGAKIPINEISLIEISK